MFGIPSIRRSPQPQYAPAGMNSQFTISEFMEREERHRVIERELGHRNKNLLAIVQAIANQTGRKSVTMEDFQTQFSRRLQGLSRSIDLLVEDGRGASAFDLVASQLEPFGGVDGARISAAGPAVLLNPDATRNIGMALHELATNALKHGSLSVPEGVVNVTWELGPDESGRKCFRMSWHEYNGPTVITPTRRGFGHIVLQCMTGQTLNGLVDHEFKASGVSWTLEVPATAIAVPTEPTELICDCRIPMRSEPLIRTAAAMAAGQPSLSPNRASCAA